MPYIKVLNAHPPYSAGVLQIPPSGACASLIYQIVLELNLFFRVIGHGVACSHGGPPTAAGYLDRGRG